MRTANIIGSGPNGLAAAITLAQRGVAVTVFERAAIPGGACSTAQLTLPGFHHDLGSSVYPLGIASPFFRTLPLVAHGLRWIHPPIPVAHPLDNPEDDGTAAALHPSLADTAAQFPPHDALAYRNLIAPSVRDWPSLLPDILRPLLSIPHHPIAMARFGLRAMQSADSLARRTFRSTAAQALFAGCAAHSVLPLTHIASAAPGLVLAATAHTTGWPILAGGAQSLTNALLSILQSLGGQLLLNTPINSLADLPPADATLFDTSTEALATIAAGHLTPAYRSSLRRFHRGPGIFKLDWALSQPIPWRAPTCALAATVHLGGSLAEIAQSEHDAFHGIHNPRPFVLLVQPSLFDPSRAPLSATGQPQHTAWAYCHVPNGSNLDLTDTIESQVSRFAPGFRDCILARRASNASALQSWNPNLLGGDVSGGAMTLPQLLARPTLRQYRTSNPALYLCSSSTPPGGGVHGMAGHHAALAALKDLGTPSD